MPKIFKIMFFVLILIMFVASPLALVHGQGLVPCSNTPDPKTGIIADTDKCDFNALMGLINKVVNFILVALAIPIAAIMFAYAGARMILAGGSTAGRETAKNVFTNTVIGLVIVAGAWLIIHTLFEILNYDASWIGF